MSERLPRLYPPFADPHRQALHAALVGGRRGTGPQAFDLTAPDGSLVGPFGLMLQAPHLGGPLEALGAAVRFETSLSARIREIAILTVAAVADSEFEQYAHERVAREEGLDDSELTAIRSLSFGNHGGADPGEVLVHRVTARLASAGPIDDETYARTVAVVGERGMLELVVLVGYFTMLAQMMSVFGVGAPEVP